MSIPKVPKRPMPGQSRLQMPLPLVNVTLNPQIFDDFLKSQGVRMLHSRPVPCPNVRDLYSPDHAPACSLCYNGFVYYDQREFVGCLVDNANSRQFNMNGTWDLDQAMIVVPTHDMKGEPLDIQFFDQILVPDFTVRYYQRVQHSQSGTDRLQFPALSIDFVMDNKGKKYLPGIDVVVQDGRLKWLKNRPGFNIATGRGDIYSVNYYTRPVFTIIAVPHQLRMAQTQSEDGPGSQNVEARFPQACIVRKDFIPYDHKDKTGAPDRPEPPSGSF